MDISKEVLLVEIDDLMRSAPAAATIRHDTDENIGWLGRVSAVVEKWNPVKSIPLAGYLTQLRSIHGRDAHGAFSAIRTLLHQARHEIRMETLGPLSVAVGHRMVFEYFDEVRKIIETATSEVLFVDPYLDAEFVSRYLTHVPNGVGVRLLTSRKRLQSLLPAAELHRTQNNTQISVRSTADLHDRFVFIDKRECYLSGTSFKDGAKNAPTTLTQITDAFATTLQTYESLWVAGQIEL